MGCALSQSGKDPEDQPGGAGDAPAADKKEKPKKNPKEKRNSNGRGLGYTVTNGKKMEILHDPHVPGGKRLVPTLGTIETSDLYIRRKTSKDGPSKEPIRRITVGTDQPEREFVAPNGTDVANGVASTEGEKRTVRRMSDPAIRAA
jgi:hypothetical protein